MTQQKSRDHGFIYRSEKGFRILKSASLIRFLKNGYVSIRKPGTHEYTNENVIMTKRILAFIGFVLVLLPARAVDSPSGIPKIALICDFNTFFPGDNAYGLRLQVYSNHHFFSDQERKKRSDEKTWTYMFGAGLGDYTVQSLDKKGTDDDVYHFYGVLLFSYRNQGFFEPFAGLYPGVAWGSKTGFFANPVIGVDITSFSIHRNWNSKLLQTYVQLKVEYNTLLSSVFFGVGVVLQFP